MRLDHITPNQFECVISRQLIIAKKHKKQGHYRFPEQAQGNREKAKAKSLTSRSLIKSFEGGEVEKQADVEDKYFCLERFLFRLIHTSLLGDHSEREPPDPISNSEVKPLSADDSVAVCHAKVGNCQALKLKTQE